MNDLCTTIYCCELIAVDFCMEYECDKKDNLVYHLSSLKTLILQPVLFSSIKFHVHVPDDEVINLDCN